MSVTHRATASKFLIFILLSIFYGRLTAENITFEIKTPPEVNLGETFRLEYILKGAKDGLNFRIPKFDDNFEIKSGPHISSNNSRLGADYEAWKSYLYIVEPKERGIFSMPISTIEIEGVEYKTNEVQLKVLAEGENSADYQYDIDAFLRTQVSRAEIYEDEAVVLSCQLYTKVSILRIKDTDYPVLADFEVGGKPFYDYEGIPVFRQEEYNGRSYYVSDLRKIVIYPNRLGKLAIPEVQATFTFDKRVLNDPPRGFYSGEERGSGVDKQLKSEPISVRVVTLPKNKPDDFSDAIGQFKLWSEIKGSQVKVGELFALKLTIEGTGDLGLASAPILDLPNGLEIYDLKSEDSSFFGDSGIQSDKIFGYLIIAKESGTYRIPPARFVYLDPESGTYKVLTSSEYTIAVAEHKIKGTVVASLY